MLPSAYSRRVTSIILLTLLLSGVFTFGFFALFSSRSLEKNMESRTLERANSLAETYAQKTSSSDTEYVNSIFSDRDYIGSYIIIFDSKGETIVRTAADTDEDVRIMDRMEDYLGSGPLSSSGKISDTGILPGIDSQEELVLAQVPVKIGGEITGTLVLMNPASEFTFLRDDLCKIMLSGIITAFIFMLIPIFIASRRLVKPLQDVNTVARAFARGDFSVRADGNPKGEIGELANSFNELADRLSRSISELTIERNRLRQIFDVISDGIVSVDLNLNPVYLNPAIQTLFENARNRNLFSERLQLIPFAEVWDDFNKCVSGGTTVERTVQSRDNAYHCTIVPFFDSSQQVLGATGFFRDISEQERLEQTRRDYVANVSHELRTPLTALRGLVEPLADGMVKNEEDRMRYYGIILHETMRLSRLIDDMLELSRLQAKTIAFKTFPFDLNDLLRDLEAKFLPIMNDARITFRVERRDGPCPTVLGNPDRVEQILVILMDNAKKYTPAGGSITITTEYREQDDRVLISVIDTGQGIHKYDIDHIFDRFYKADRARGKKGTGLGLSIAKELLNYMGETITVKSEYEKGTTFTFTLKCVHGTMWY